MAFSALHLTSTQLNEAYLQREALGDTAELLARAPHLNTVTSGSSNTQQRKTKGIPALHWTTVHSAFGNRNRSGKKSFPASSRSVVGNTHQAAAPRVKILPPGLFDPTLKSDQLQADERRRTLQQRRRLRQQEQCAVPHQAAGLAACNSIRRNYTTNVDDGSYTRHRCVPEPQYHWKREASLAELLLSGPTFRETIAHEAKLTESGIVAGCSHSRSLYAATLTDKRPQLQVMDKRTQREMAVQMSMQGRGKVRPWAAMQAPSQGGGNVKYLGRSQPQLPSQRKASVRNLRRIQLLARQDDRQGVLLGQDREAAEGRRPPGLAMQDGGAAKEGIFPAPAWDTWQSAQHTHSIRSPEHVELRTIPLIDGAPRLHTHTLSESSEPGKAGKNLPAVEEKALANELVPGRVRANGSTDAGCVGDSSDPLENPLEGCNYKVPESSSLLLLRSTIQKVESLQQKLSRYVFSSPVGEKGDDGSGGGGPKSQVWLEALVLELAEVLRIGPSGGIAQGSDCLLAFLRQQQGRMLHVTKVRHLLKRVRHCLRHAANCESPSGFTRPSNAALIAAGILTTCRGCSSKERCRRFQSQQCELRTNEPHVTSDCPAGVSSRQDERFRPTEQAASVCQKNSDLQPETGCLSLPLIEAKKQRNLEHSLPTQVLNTAQAEPLINKQLSTATSLALPGSLEAAPTGLGVHRADQANPTDICQTAAKHPSAIFPANCHLMQGMAGNYHVATQVATSLSDVSAVQRELDKKQSCLAYSSNRGQRRQEDLERPGLCDVITCLLRLQESECVAAATLKSVGEQFFPSFHHDEANMVEPMQYRQLTWQFLQPMSAYMPAINKLQTQDPREPRSGIEMKHSYALKSDVKQRILAFRDLRREAQLADEPLLEQENLQQALLQLRTYSEGCGYFGDEVAGVWTLHAAIAEQVLDRELERLLSCVIGATSTFVDRLLEAEAARMAGLMGPVWLSEFALTSEPAGNAC